MKEIKNKLSNEIDCDLEQLGEMDVDDERYKVAVDSVTKLVDRLIEIEKEDHNYLLKKKELELSKFKYESDISDKDKNRELNAEMEKNSHSLKVEELEINKKKYEEELEINKKKYEDESTDRFRAREIEKSKLEQIKNEKKDQLIKNIISISNIAITTFITIWGTFKTFEFEKTGSVTTIMGRGFINKLIPKK